MLLAKSDIKPRLNFLLSHLWYIERLYNTNKKLYLSIFIIFENNNYCISNPSNVIEKGDSEDMLVFITIDDAWCILLFNKNLGIVNIFNFSQLSDEGLHTFLLNKNFRVNSLILNSFQLTYHKDNMDFEFLKIYNMLGIFSIVQKNDEPSLRLSLLFLKTIHSLFHYKTHLLMAMNRSQFDFFYDNINSSELFCLTPTTSLKINSATNLSIKKNIPLHVQLRQWVNNLSDNFLISELHSILNENEELMPLCEVTYISFLLDRNLFSDISVDESIVKIYETPEFLRVLPTVQLVAHNFKLFIDWIDVELVKTLEGILAFKLDLFTEATLSNAVFTLIFRNTNIGQHGIKSYDDLSKLLNMLKCLKFPAFLELWPNYFFLNLKGLDRFFSELVKYTELENFSFFPSFHNNGIFPLLKFDQTLRERSEEVHGSLKLFRYVTYKQDGPGYLANQPACIVVDLHSYENLYDRHGKFVKHCKRYNNNTRLCSSNVFKLPVTNKSCSNNEQNLRISKDKKAFPDISDKTKHEGIQTIPGLPDASLSISGPSNLLKNIEVKSNDDDIQMLRIKKLSIPSIFKEAFSRSQEKQGLAHFVVVNKQKLKLFFESLKSYSQDNRLFVNDESCSNCILKGLDCLRILPYCIHCFVSSSNCRYARQSNITDLKSPSPRLEKLVFSKDININREFESKKLNFNMNDTAPEISTASLSSHSSRLPMNDNDKVKNGKLNMSSNAVTSNNSEALLCKAIPLTTTTARTSKDLCEVNLRSDSNRNLQPTSKIPVSFSSNFSMSNRASQNYSFLKGSKISDFLNSLEFKKLVELGKRFSLPFPLLPKNWHIICRSNKNNTLSFEQVNNLQLAYFYHAYSYLRTKEQTENGKRSYFSIASRFFFYKLVLAQNKDLIIIISILMEIIRKYFDIEAKKMLTNESTEMLKALHLIYYELMNISEIFVRVVKFLNKIKFLDIYNMLETLEDFHLNQVNEYMSLLKYFEETYFKNINFGFLRTRGEPIRNYVSMNDDPLFALISFMKSGKLLLNYPTIVSFFSCIGFEDIFEMNSEGFVVLSKPRNLLFCLNMYSPNKTFHFDFIRDETFTMDDLMDIIDINSTQSLHNQFATPEEPCGNTENINFDIRKQKPHEVVLLCILATNQNNQIYKSLLGDSGNVEQVQSSVGKPERSILKDSNSEFTCDENRASNIITKEESNNNEMHNISNRVLFIPENQPNDKFTKNSSNVRSNENLLEKKLVIAIGNEDNHFTDVSYGKSLGNPDYHIVDRDATKENPVIIFENPTKRFETLTDRIMLTMNKEKLLFQKDQDFITAERHSDNNDSSDSNSKLVDNSQKSTLADDILKDFCHIFKKELPDYAHIGQSSEIDSSAMERQSIHINRIKNENKILKATNENSLRKIKIKREIEVIKHQLQVEKTKFELFELRKKLELLTQQKTET